MTAVYIEYQNTLTKDESGEFYWRQEYDFKVKSASLNKPRPSENTIEKLNIAGELTLGQQIWIVSIITMIADSFGCGKGEGEVTWAFRTMESATSAMEAITGCKESPSIEFADDTGTEIRLSNPACCFHDCIDDVILTTLILQ